MTDPLDAMLDAVRAELEKGVREEARRFLAKLDPDSSEGMWFDAFAESFPSRLDAALAYLRGFAVHY